LCIGVISENLARILEQNDIKLHPSKIQQEIKGYFFQAPQLGVQLEPPHRIKSIYAVFRGNGPRFSLPDMNISFDDILLQHNIDRGIEHISEQVIDLSIPKNAENPATITTRLGNQEKRYRFDLIVGAFGLHSPLLPKIAELGFGYHSPKMISTLMCELPLPEEWVKERFRDNIVVYTFPSRRIRYVIVVPKKRYLSISIINRGNATREDLKNFLQSNIFASYLPKNGALNPRFCTCLPRIALSSAGRPYSNRLVLIGDVSYTRIYKNGIESAYYTAMYAAETAIKHGISKRNFRRNYSRPMKKLFVLDNFFGRLMFFIYDYISRNQYLSEGFLRALLYEKKKRMNRYLHNLVWNMFTGGERYQKIILQFINPFCQIFILHKTFETFWQKINSGNSRQKDYSEANYNSIRDNPANPGLKDDSVVGIVGGGPGGIACAITLKNIAKELGINIRTVIYEGKTYSGVPHYNQCVGVLSPPIRSLLEDQLNIPFPDHLLQRMITGYILNSDKKQINLPDESEFSLAVRRITFDSYLLEEAEKKGVEFRQSRVTDVELHKDCVILYSESDNLRADVVVGAFGLDDGSIKIFERITTYQAPEFLTSIVTKIHPGLKYMSRIGSNIIAYLPPFRKIEFGAITPKKNHIDINIAGKNIDATCMDLFLRYPPVQQILPKNEQFDQKLLYYFKGKFPVSLAKNFYGDRYVMLGDAAGLVRPFKGKGVNSAIESGINVALVMMHEGVSRKAFKTYEKLCREITHDMPYGYFMRRFAIFSANHGLLDFMISFANQNQIMRRALFNSISAHKLYREILRETLKWSFLKNIARSLYQYQKAKSHIRDWD
jgi:flavin-dependent dehydrogenase